MHGGISDPFDFERLTGYKDSSDILFLPFEYRRGMSIFECANWSGTIGMKMRVGFC